MKTTELINRLQLEDPDKDHYVNHLGGVVVSFDDVKSNTIPDVGIIKKEKYSINDVIKITTRTPRYHIKVISKGLTIEGYLEWNTTTNLFFITHVLGDRRVLHRIPSGFRCAFNAGDVTYIDYENNQIFLG
jgi:hypothetical protein